jgi:TorA maturation chaperone TorD
MEKGDQGKKEDDQKKYDANDEICVLLSFLSLFSARETKKERCFSFKLAAFLCLDLAVELVQQIQERQLYRVMSQGRLLHAL